MFCRQHSGCEIVLGKERPDTVTSMKSLFIVLSF
jgi:hypothetical protein